MKTRIELSDFRFMPSGHGHYSVTYTSPLTLKSWVGETCDMPLIDKTKGEDEPKKKDLL